MNPPHQSAVALAAAGAEQPIPLNVLFGVPDYGAGMVRASPDGRRLVAPGANPLRRSFTLKGSANIAPYLSAERFALNRFYLQAGAALRLNLGPGPILNHIADPDVSARALDIAATIVDRTGRPCFNHPAAVARTTRDGIARLLAGIPQLHVPKTIRVTAQSIADVRAAADEARMTYPILARIAGSHGGSHRVFVQRPDEMDAITQLERNRSPLYLTEFRDFISPDGYYRKFRIVVVGDDIFLRHCVVGEQWGLQGRNRAAGKGDEEAEIFDSFAAEWAPALQPVFSEMTRRLDLDYYGVDCNIDSERNVLLFEANACMKILKNYRPPPNIFERPIGLIKEALEKRLASPGTWRCSRRSEHRSTARPSQP
jgi:glutathione synthase/RimK-type ligase-like ATP-grasp enzyme